jgi:outer membrane protein assembly factor BamA
MLAGSNGTTPERLYLGGHTSLRGSEYEAVDGSRLGFASAELRVPLVNEIRLAWPVRRSLTRVSGVLFTDSGIAWDKGASPQIGRRTEQGYELADLLLQYGFGLRARIIGLHLRWDLARGYDLRRSTEWRSHFRVDHDF